jgi:hypothetical protein
MCYVATSTVGYHRLLEAMISGRGSCMGYSTEKFVIRYGQRAIMEKKQLQEKYNGKIKKKVYEERKEKLFSRKTGSTKERRSGGR